MGPVVLAPGTEILNQVLRMEGVKRWKQFMAFSKKRGRGGGGGVSPAIKLFSTKKVVVLVPKHTVHPFLVYFEKKVSLWGRGGGVATTY